MAAATLLAAAVNLWMLPPLSVTVWAGHMIIFHGLGVAFELCDRSNALQAFKVRKRNRLGYAAVLPRVLFNQCCVLLPAMWLCERSGLAFSGPSAITFRYVAVALLLLTIGHDVVQYTAHRWLLHNVRFGWLKHNLHHSTGASRAISACYMSAPDFFLTIVCPYLVPLILIGGGTSNLGFNLLVACLGAVGGLYEHSGYDFSPGPAAVPRRWLSFVPASLFS